MSEAFFKAIKDFQRKYVTKEEKEQALLEMSADQILQLSRSCGSIQEACYYARFAQKAAIRESGMCA